jgi:hypothetical protein
MSGWWVVTRELGAPKALVVFFPGNGCDGTSSADRMASNLEWIGESDVALAAVDYDEAFDHLDERGGTWSAVAPYRMVDGYGGEQFDLSVERGLATVEKCRSWYPNLPLVIWGYSQGGPVALEVAAKVGCAVMVWCTWAMKPPKVGGLAVAHLNSGDHHVDHEIAAKSLVGVEVHVHDRRGHSEDVDWLRDFLRRIR